MADISAVEVDYIRPLLPECSSNHVSQDDFDTDRADSFALNSASYYKVSIIMSNHALTHMQNILMSEQAIMIVIIKVYFWLLQDVLQSTIPGLVLGGLSLICFFVFAVWVSDDINFRCDIVKNYCSCIHYEK